MAASSEELTKDIVVALAQMKALNDPKEVGEAFKTINQAVREASAAPYPERKR